MNGGKEDCRRYNVQCTKYQVPGTKIPQKYDLGQNTNPYFVLRTWYLVQPPTSSFFNQRSAFDISKNLYKVPSTMYPAFGRQARFLSSTIWVRTRIHTLYFVPDTWFSPPLLHSSISVRYSTLKKVASS